MTPCECAKRPWHRLAEKLAGITTEDLLRIDEIERLAAANFRGLEVLFARLPDQERAAAQCVFFRDLGKLVGEFHYALGFLDIGKRLDTAARARDWPAVERAGDNYIASCLAARN